MLKDFSSEIEIKRMNDKKNAEQAIIKVREERNKAKKRKEDAELELNGLEKKQKSLEEISKFNPITKFLSTFFKRGKYYEYLERGREEAIIIQEAQRSLREAEKDYEASEIALDDAIKENDAIIIPKQYGKNQDDILIINDSDGLNHEKTKVLPKEGRVLVHCTNFFPFSGEIISNFEGGKVLETTESYHGVIKKVSSISNRHEVHFSVNARVQSTGDGAGNWDSPKYMVVDLLDDNEGLNEDDLELDNPSDSWTKGKNIKLSPHAVILVREDALEELNLSSEDIKKHRIVIYSGNPTKCLENFLTLNNYKIQETDPKYKGHSESVEYKQEFSEDRRNFAINYVTNKPVLTKEKPVLDAVQLGRVIDVFMQNAHKSVEFHTDKIRMDVIDSYMKGHDIAPEDREKFSEVIDFIFLTGLTRTGDKKGFTFKDSEQIIDLLQYTRSRLDLVSSPANLSIPTSEFVFEVFQARKKAELEYSKLETPPIESIKEMTMEQLSEFKNQKSAEVVARKYGESAVIFDSDEVELRGNYPEFKDLSLKYEQAVKEGKDMPKCGFIKSENDACIKVACSGDIKVCELGDYFEKLGKLAQGINAVELKSPNEVAKESEEDSRPANF